MSKVTFKLVNVVCAFATTAGVLTVYRVYTKASRSYAKNQGILQGILTLATYTENNKAKICKTDLRPYGAVVFGIALHSKV